MIHSSFAGDLFTKSLNVLICFPHIPTLASYIIHIGCNERVKNKLLPTNISQLESRHYKCFEIAFHTEECPIVSWKRYNTQNNMGLLTRGTSLPGLKEIHLAMGKEKDVLYYVNMLRLIYFTNLSLKFYRYLIFRF